MDRKIKITPCGTYYLTRRDKKRKELFTVSSLVFKASQDKNIYAICLELGILGKGQNEFEAFQDLIALIENDIYSRAHAKIPIKIKPAEEKYRSLFLTFNKQRKMKLIPTSTKFNDISKKYSGYFNPAAPSNYEMVQPLV